MDLITGQNVSKVYQTGEVAVTTLKGVTFTIPKGSFLSVIGPSGSGKTTLLNLIGCLNKPSGGRLFVAGKDVSSLGKTDAALFRGKHIGFIFQNFNLIPVLTAYMKKIGLSILFLILALLITSSVYADDKGKVALAAEGKTAAADVSAVASRCPYFLIFDSANSLLEVLDNPYNDTGRKAGPSVAAFLAQKGVTFVVAGQFGDNMIQAMKGKGMEYLEFRGSAEAALETALCIKAISPS